jgi:hypothetical protein
MIIVADYKKMYTRLFNAATDAVNILQSAQVETEKMYIEHDPTPLTLLNSEDDNGGNGGDGDANSRKD